MKVPVIVALGIISCISTTLAEGNEKKSYVQATVLFYVDDNGNKVVAAGHVPKKVVKIIKRNLKMMGKYVSGEITSAFNDVHDVPPIEQATEIIKQKYKLVFVENVPKSVMFKIMAHKRRQMSNITSHLQHYDVSNYTDSVKSLTKNVLNKNLDPIPKHFETAPMIINSYVPNTVYYAINFTEHPVFHKNSNFKDILFKMSNAWKKIKSVIS
ncbi:uncharacterized protein LOC111360990 [Spodoptera litura]|uniref:Uncharacterized protein LOC111360990 n=1 Tax=Spodoptera litura TaxID=69820 RepID=A0A9J7J3G7_SPOLT|nr:uncharacterized protein LOC111360990 [Spodoptera litura]